MIPGDLTVIDWIGVLGSLVIAAAYFAVSRGLVDATRPAFNILNFGGAVLILVSLYFRPNAGAIVMESLWALIALAALVRYLMHGR